MKELREALIGIGLIILLIMFMHKCSSAAEYKFIPYHYVGLKEIVDNPDKYNSEEIQVRGMIHEIQDFVGVYQGEYVGLLMDEGIMIFVYKAEIHTILRKGDSILVDGTFHIYSLYGGQGHSNYIAVHKLQRVE